MVHADSTIFALSSGQGRAGVAVIRISGPGATRTYYSLTQADSTKLEPNRAHVKALHHPHTDQKLDDALVLYFKGPRSFTGEDCLELQVHGGRAVVRSILDALSEIEDLRPAEPGEFTRRGFENGKMDLTAAEGLNDLIQADTARQQTQALAHASGKAAKKYEQWRSEIIRLMARLEADLDFSDEDDVPEDVTADIAQAVEALRTQMQEQLQQSTRGEIIRDGFRVVLAGQPNVGKSSLLNALAKRDVAIVSEEAGTTRDMIEVHLDLDGLPVTISDTAGLRTTDSKVELEGIRRTQVALQKAQLVLWITDGTSTETGPADAAHMIHVRNKIDLGSAETGDIQVSATDGTNLDGLIQAIAKEAERQTDGSEPPIITRARHRHLVTEAVSHLTQFLNGSSDMPELRAEDLRRAATCIGQITGRIDVEEMLGEIFSSFCIGK